MRKRGLLFDLIIGLVLVLVILETGMWVAFGSPFLPFPAQCTVGVTGTAATITFSGIGAHYACQYVMQQSSQIYLMESGTPQGDEICEGDTNTYPMMFHYLVRDTGLFKITGIALCAMLRKRTSSSLAG